MVRVTLTQCVQYMTSLGFNDKRVIEDYENLGEEHQILKPELVTPAVLLAFPPQRAADAGIDSL